MFIFKTCFNNIATFSKGEKSLKVLKDIMMEKNIELDVTLGVLIQ